MFCRSQKDFSKSAEKSPSLQDGYKEPHSSMEISSIAYGAE
jgi:hypothetical protein